jgi:glycerol-3-phosphate dehydrogenase (NAD(P)+)
LTATSDLRIAVVGAGSWGTTLASLACRSPGRPPEVDGRSARPTVLWAREREIADAINERHANAKYLSSFPLPAALRATTSLPAALDAADAVVMAVPSPFFRDVFRDVARLLDRRTPVLSVVKGIEPGSLLRMTEVVAEESGHDPSLIGVLSGPNLAREVMAGQPAATVIALPDEAWAQRLQARLTTRTFRVYTNTDVIGCEISGAVKNVIAIAAGIADGLGYGVNTKAALITRGLAELVRLGTSVGGQALTFLGLAGNGDLVATCSSPNSRNHHVGVELAKGRATQDIVNEMHMVAEGIKATPGVLAIAGRTGVEMPIVREVSAVIDGQRSPVDAVDHLMGREPRPELDGVGSRTGARLAPVATSSSRSSGQR